MRQHELIRARIYISMHHTHTQGNASSAGVEIPGEERGNRNQEPGRVAEAPRGCRRSVASPIFLSLLTL